MLDLEKCFLGSKRQRLLPKHQRIKNEQQFYKAALVLCSNNPIVYSFYGSATKYDRTSLNRFAGNSPLTIHSEKIKNPLDEFLILLDDC
jgi:hypothetical protein